ncbi:MAG TPA: Fe(3+) ABC transporter substrate-binding protein, partial [Gammaproteobacteria bacterium]|nr:Fe(3+) ABC transporter substrate-binding protein [Gammaproteobacteria bacterium]
MNIEMKYTYVLVIFLIFQQPVNAAEVNIYSARKEALIKPLL